MRVPWVGWIAIQVQNAGVNNNYTMIGLIIALIFLLIIVEFIAPLLKSKMQKPLQTTPLSTTDPINMPPTLQCFHQTLTTSATYTWFLLWLHFGFRQKEKATRQQIRSRRSGDVVSCSRCFSRHIWR
jgi:hypothetical protein